MNNISINGDSLLRLYDGLDPDEKLFVGQVRLDVGALQAVSEMRDGWIPVKNKYPVDGVAVLASTTNGTVKIASYRGEHFKRWDTETGTTYGLDEIVAWRPLPEPYQKD